MSDWQTLEARLGHRFDNPALLREALTHRSFGTPHNERLEFLGDSVLGLVISTELFHRFGELREGELSRLRAQLVREQTLQELAAELDLGAAVRLGEGVHKSGGAQRSSILADALEALFGAIYAEAGFDAASRAILRLYAARLAALDPSRSTKDPKTRLQELLQSRRLALPGYHLLSTQGAAHQQIFEVACAIEKLGVRTVGRGPSRRIAEQDAARQALEILEA
jgi:ribonuclease III